MATKKQTPADEKLEKQDFDLFEALAAIDKKDYGYYDRLTEEQQKKFVPYMLTYWVSCVQKQKTEIQRYYVMSTNEIVNTHLFNEFVQKHPKLQWLMLCAASPGVGKMFHQYIPHIKASITSLREPAKQKDIKDYYGKVYKGLDDGTLDELAEAFIIENKKKYYLAKEFPSMKFTDLELLSKIINDDEIRNYEEQKGN